MCERSVARRKSAPETGSHSPDPQEFIREIIDQGFYLPIFSLTMGFLNTCQAERKIPDQKTLYRLLLPWSSYPGYG